MAGQITSVNTNHLELEAQIDRLRDERDAYRFHGEQAQRNYDEVRPLCLSAGPSTSHILAIS